MYKLEVHRKKTTVEVDEAQKKVNSQLFSPCNARNENEVVERLFSFFKEKKVLRLFIGQKIITNYYVNSYTWYTSMPEILLLFYFNHRFGLCGCKISVAHSNLHGCQISATSAISADDAEFLRHQPFQQMMQNFYDIRHFSR